MKWALSLCAAFLLATPAIACGPDSDCVIGDRTYRLYVPDGVDGPVGAYFFAHGFRGSAAGAMRNSRFMRLADEFGLAFVALDAGQDSWRLAHHPSDPDRPEALEYDYVRDVIDDLASRVDLDRDRLALTGFSSGGMFTWTMICGLSDQFTGFIPYAGTFWHPVPATCATPPSNVVHIHGTEDRTVPLGGRAIGTTRQGDVPDALAMYRDHGDFGPASVQTAPGDMRCEERENPNGFVFDFCTFDGGHSFSLDRVRHGLLRVLGGA